MTCALGAVTVVGAFTSGAGPSNDAPAAPMGGSLIEGMLALQFQCVLRPLSGEALRGALGGGGGGTRLYNVYAGTPEMPLVRLLDGDSLNSRSAAQVAVAIPEPCGSPPEACGCALSTRPVTRVRRSTWEPSWPTSVRMRRPTLSTSRRKRRPDDAGIDAHDARVDAGIDAAPDVTLDAALAAPDARADGAASGSDVAPPRPRTTSGGGCQVGGSPGAAVSLMPLALLAVAALLRRRRR